MVILNQNRVKRRKVLTTTGALTAGLLAGCSSGGGESTSTAANDGGGTGSGDDREFVRFQNSADMAGGSTVPYYNALEEGFYEDEGVAINLQRGFGSGDTVKKIASGTRDVGQPTLSAVLSAFESDNELPITVVGASIPIPPNGYFYIEGRDGIEEPTDIEGKTIGLVPGSGDAALFPIALEEIGLERSDVDVQDATFSTIYPLLAEGDLDVATGWFLQKPVMKNVAEENGIDPSRVKFVGYARDLGIELYGQVLVANNDWLADNENDLSMFLSALAKSYKHAAENPDVAFENWFQNNRAKDEENHRSRFDLARQMWTDPYIEENGYLQISEEKLSSSTEIIADTADLEFTPSMDTLFTNEYLPSVLPP